MSNTNPVAGTRPGSNPEQSQADIDAAAERTWAASPEIRAEFGDNKPVWMAYRRAEAAGRFRLLSNRDK